MNETEIVVSAPGKVILHGEHAVVYGKSALAASLNLRSYARLTNNTAGLVSLNLPTLDVKLSWRCQELQCIVDINKVDIWNPERPSDELITKINTIVNPDTESRDSKNLAAVAFVYLYTALCQGASSLPSLSVTVASKLPVGAGLGSSASFSVCLAASLLLKQGYITAPGNGKADSSEWSEKDLDLINKWAYQGETIIHGRPSGIDNSVSTFGGAIKFQGGKITKLDKIPNLRILLTSTHVPRSTKVLVAKVRDRYDKFPDIMQSVMDSVEGVSEKCQQTYVTMTTNSQNASVHFTTLEELIDINQHLLQVMGVSHVTLDRICHVTSKYSLHSKLTGAGGGGCAFTLLNPSTDTCNIEKIKKELEPDGFDCWETNIGADGVMIHLALPEDLLAT